MSKNQKPEAKINKIKFRSNKFILLPMEFDRYLLAKWVYLDQDLQRKFLIEKHRIFFSSLLRDDERSWPIGDGFFVVLVSTLQWRENQKKTNEIERIYIGTSTVSIDCVDGI